MTEEHTDITDAVCEAIWNVVTDVGRRTRIEAARAAARARRKAAYEAEKARLEAAGSEARPLKTGGVHLDLDEIPFADLPDNLGARIDENVEQQVTARFRKFDIVCSASDSGSSGRRFHLLLFPEGIRDVPWDQLRLRG